MVGHPDVVRHAYVVRDAHVVGHAYVVRDAHVVSGINSSTAPIGAVSAPEAMLGGTNEVLNQQAPLTEADYPLNLSGSPNQVFLPFIMQGQ